MGPLAPWRASPTRVTHRYEKSPPVVGGLKHRSA
eukprot:gene406-402_t